MNKSLKLFFSILSQARYGSIAVFHDEKKLFSHKSPNQGPNSKIIINDFKCIDNFLAKGDIGWAEAYIKNYWETNELSLFLEWGARNFHEFTSYIRGKWYVILYLRMRHYLNRNTREGSKKNIKFQQHGLLIS